MNDVIFMSPLCKQRRGHIALPLSAQSVSACAVSLLCCESVPIHFSPPLTIVQAVKHETLTQCWANVGALHRAGGQTRDVDPMLGVCWPTVYDADPTLAQY